MVTGAIHVRKSDARGYTVNSWLDSRHTFSFDTYHDPEHMGFHDLRVINEDIIQPVQGFGMHSHQDMEIVTYVISGVLEHQDSLGNRLLIRPGEIQRMTAGSGIRHSEFNASMDEPAHLLQIWIKPDQKGLPPGYEQKMLVDRGRKDAWQLVASPDARSESMWIHQDVRLYAALLDDNARLTYELPGGRAAWVQVVQGVVRLSGELLGAGDGAGIETPGLLELVADAPQSEILLFDLAQR